ncbi:hypothetical protein HC723_15720 [Vibrio sp. S11_S32]|uniref:hypothetical protein n=1 Tax=Vibrio sp. S11_S32 TaxID=2720225 RepID=UPI00168104A4|nr:hypothetical protein [Vibrio sp. S11_S32]MBD1577846.1 hypothetical protein [Vibrio sp. S11_S32]
MLKINLNSPEGNIFYLLGVAKRLAPQMGLNAEEIVTEMKSGTYNNGIEVFKKHFRYVVRIEGEL